MHAIFAVEPEAVSSWKELCYVLEKFGFSNGALIANYPSKWMRMVIDACAANGASDLDLSRITEKLRQAKEDRVIKLGLPYEAPSWREAVQGDRILEKLDAVLVNEDVPNDKFHNVNNGLGDLFENRRECQLERTAESLAGAARCLLMGASELVLVDPYFKAHRKCTKVLGALIRLAFDCGNRLKRVCIYTSFDVDQVDPDVAGKMYQDLLHSLSGVGTDVSVYRLESDRLDMDFHARYLLTPNAGLRYDRGFVEPVKKEERLHLTDVVCMDRAAVTGKIELFNEERMGRCAVDVIRFRL
jgi:hypothetical protein